MICRCVINTYPGKNILFGMSKGKSFDLMQTCIEKNAIITSTYTYHMQKSIHSEGNK